MKSMKTVERILTAASISLVVMKCLGFIDAPMWIVMMPFTMAVISKIVYVVKCLLLAGAIQKLITMSAALLEYLNR